MIISERLGNLNPSVAEGGLLSLKILCRIWGVRQPSEFWTNLFNLSPYFNHSFFPLRPMRVIPIHFVYLNHVLCFLKWPTSWFSRSIQLGCNVFPFQTTSFVIPLGIRFVCVSSKFLSIDGEKEIILKGETHGWKWKHKQSEVSLSSDHPQWTIVCEMVIKMLPF